MLLDQGPYVLIPPVTSSSEGCPPYICEPAVVVAGILDSQRNSSSSGLRQRLDPIASSAHGGFGLSVGLTDQSVDHLLTLGDF